MKDLLKKKNNYYYLLLALKHKRFVFPSWGQLLLVVFLSLSLAVIELTFPFLAEFSVDKIIILKKLEKLSAFFSWSSIIYFLYWLMGFFYSLASFQISLLNTKRIRSIAFSILMSNYNFNEKRQTTDMMLSIESDSSAIINSILKIFDVFSRSIIVIPVSLYLIYTKSRNVFILLVLFILLKGAVSRFFIRLFRKKSAILREYSFIIREFIMDSLHKLKIIYFFNRSSFFIKKYQKVQNLRLNAQKSMFWIRKFDWLLNNVILAVFKLLIAYSIIKEVMEGDMTSGESFFVGIIIFKLQSVIIQLFASFRDIGTLNESAKRLFNILEVDIKEIKQQPVVLDKIRLVEFKKVSFAYPGKKQLINNLSFSIKEKEKVIIYGKSGKGKTTVFNILAAVLKPVEGQVMINGYNVNTIDLKRYNELISFVPQENDIFQLNFLDNIYLGRNDKYQMNQDNLLKISGLNILESIDNNDNIYNGTKSTFSFGELRRMIIARGVLNDASLILMDEPDANLGDDLAVEVMSAFFKQQNKTIILFTHRKSILPLADRIIEL